MKKKLNKFKPTQMLSNELGHQSEAAGSLACRLRPAGPGRLAGRDALRAAEAGRKMEGGISSSMQRRIDVRCMGGAWEIVLFLLSTLLTLFNNVDRKSVIVG